MFFIHNRIPFHISSQYPDCCWSHLLIRSLDAIRGKTDIHIFADFHSKLLEFLAGRSFMELFFIVGLISVYPVWVYSQCFDISILGPISRLLITACHQQKIPHQQSMLLISVCHTKRKQHLCNYVIWRYNVRHALLVIIREHTSYLSFLLHRQDTCALNVLTTI